MDKTRIPDEALEARSQVLESQMAGCRVQIGDLLSEQAEIRTELARRRQPASLRAAIALIPRDDIPPFWQSGFEIILGHVSNVLGPQATVSELLAIATKPDQDLRAWVDTLPANSEAREWFLDAFFGTLSDSGRRNFTNVFTRMVQQIA